MTSLLERIKSFGYTEKDYKQMDSPPYKTDSVEETVKWNEFMRAIKHRDFSVGDILWINDVEFEVKRIRKFKIFR